MINVWLSCRTVSCVLCCVFNLLLLLFRLLAAYFCCYFLFSDLLFG